MTLLLGLRVGSQPCGLGYLHFAKAWKKSRSKRLGWVKVRLGSKTKFLGVAPVSTWLFRPLAWRGKQVARSRSILKPFSECSTSSKRQHLPKIQAEVAGTPCAHMYGRSSIRLSPLHDAIDVSAICRFICREKLSPVKASPSTAALPLR